MITGKDLPAQRFMGHLTPTPLSPMDAWFWSLAIGPAIVLAMIKQFHTDAHRHLRRP